MLQFDEAISSTVRTDGKRPQPKASPAAGPLSTEQLDKMQRYWSAAIAPGYTRTPGTTTQGLELEQLAKTIPAKRVADATEIAGATVYLASDEANYVHGTTLSVDGGMNAV